jgi:UDP-N-acetylglucosamine transferase subunit ALG13
MILVTVGASQFPFDRLLRAVDELAVGEDIVVQHGSSTLRPLRGRCVDFLPFEALAEHVASARIVVTHGGVGSIMVSLAHGKRPLVVPRRRCFGETVDDHQVESARRFANAGLVTLVSEPRDLATALAEAPLAPAHAPGAGELQEEIRSYLAEVIHPRHRTTYSPAS